MSLRTADHLEAVRHLPAGATLTFYAFAWDEYERLLEDLSGKSYVRVSYDHGKLEVMSPLPEHEDYARLLDYLVRAVSEARNLKLENRGSATWKKRSLAKGVEPDGCYYVQNADRIIGKRTIDLESDPPPDIVVEIDVTTESLSKFPIYSALSVQEIWRYDGKIVQFYELSIDAYREVVESRAFPGFHPTAQSPRGGGPGFHPTAQSPRGGGPGFHPTAQSPRGGGPGLKPEMLAEALEQSKTEGQTAALAAFRERLERFEAR